MIDRADWSDGGGLPVVVNTTTPPAVSTETARPDWSGAAAAARPSAATANNTVVDELDAEDAAIELGMLANGLTREEIGRLRGKPPEHVARPPVTPQSIARELAKIDKLRRTDRQTYNADVELQAYERRLLEAQQQRAAQPEKAVEKAAASNDEGGLPQSLLNEFEQRAGVAHHLGLLHGTVTSILGSLEEAEAVAFQSTWDALPETVQTAAYRYLAVDGGAFPRASEEELRDFSETGGGAELLAAWGSDAPKRLGIVRGRIDLIASSMTPADQNKFDAFLDGLTAAQAVAVFRALGG